MILPRLSALPWVLPITALMIGPHVAAWDQISTETYDFADAHISLWSLWWTGHALAEGLNPFWTDYVFFPHGTSLAFHSYPFVYGLLSIPIQQLVPGKHGLALAYNLAIVSSFAVSALGAYLLALRATGHVAASRIAGLLYAFAPYHILNSCRLAVLSIELLPFYVLALLRLGEKPSAGRAAALALCLALTYYNAIEYALYLVLFSLGWLGRELRRGHSAARRGLLGRVALAALVFAALTAPLFVQQIATAARESDAVGHKLSEAVRWSSALASFVTPSRTHPLYGGLWAFAGEFRDGHTAGMRSETALGFTALLLAGFALCRRARDGRAFWGFTALGFFLLCLGPYLRVHGTWTTEIPLPYRVLYEVLPPLRAVKEPTRAFPMLLLAVSVLAAFGARDLIARAGSRRSAGALAALLAGLVLFEDLSAWPWQPTRHETVEAHPFYHRLARDSDVVAIMDLSGFDATLIAQPVHRKKTSEWQGFIPRAAAAFRATPLRELGDVLRRPNDLLRLDRQAQIERVARYRGALRDGRVRYLLLPPAHGDAERSFQQSFAAALGGRLRAEPGLRVIDLAPRLAQ